MGRLKLKVQDLLSCALACILAASAWSYAQLTFKGLAQAQMIVMGLQEKPFVYRALVPWLARGLVALGLPADVALSLVVVGSAIGLFYSIKYLLPRSGELLDSLIAFVAVEIFMQLFSVNAKPYDLNTALFFAFCLGLLARHRFKAFYAMYFLGCLNRETMFLLTIVFAIWFLNRMELRSWLKAMGMQGLIFAGARGMLMKFYEANPGAAFVSNPLRLLHDYLAYPTWTLSILAVMALAGFLVAWHWRHKPGFLRCALLVMFPLLLVMHILFGWAFEIRHFIEAFPVVVALAAWGVGNPKSAGK